MERWDDQPCPLSGNQRCISNPDPLLTRGETCNFLTYWLNACVQDLFGAFDRISGNNVTSSHTDLMKVDLHGHVK